MKMLKKTFEAAGPGLLVLTLALIASCGNGGEGEWAKWGGDSRDDLMEEAGVKVALCPKSGGEVKFLELDSLTLSGSALNIPPATIHLGGSVPSARFAALTEETLHLISTEDFSDILSFSIPKISKESRIIAGDEEMLILDRKARKLVGIDLLSGAVEMERTFLQQPEEIYYSPSRGKVILVLRKGSGGVINVMTQSSGESMTINLDEIICSEFVEERGEIYLITEGTDGVGLESFKVDDLSRTLDVKLESSPGSIKYAEEREKLYVYTPSTGIVAAIDPEDGAIVSEIPLSGRGEGQLFADDTGQRVYLLMKETGHLSVISTEKDLLAGEIESGNGDTRLLITPHSRYILLQDNDDSRVRLYDGNSFQLLRVFMEGEPVTMGLLRENAGSPEKEEVLLAEERPEIPRVEPPGDAPPSTEDVDPMNLFTLQVFSSDSLSSSERVAGNLIDGGFPSVIEEAMVVGKGTWYRVKVGEFSSRDDAEAVGSYLSRAFGLDFWATPLAPSDLSDTAGADMMMSGFDMDDDGYPEIAVVDPAGTVHIFSLHGSRFIKRWTYALPEDQSLCGAISYADENGDGLPEALLPLCPSESSCSIAWNGDVFTGQSG